MSGDSAKAAGTSGPKENIADRRGAHQKTRVFGALWGKTVRAEAMVEVLGTFAHLAASRIHGEAREQRRK